METKEKMQAYIEKTKIKDSYRYAIYLSGLKVLWEMIRHGEIFEALILAFDYGRAKGYRMGRKRESTKSKKEKKQ